MGWKAKKIDFFRLKHRNLRPICIRLHCHSHGFAALRHCYCQPISMLLHEKHVSKRIEKSRNFTQQIDTHSITKPPHISRIYNKQGCCLQIRQRWRGVCQEKGQLKFCFEHGRFVPLLRSNLLTSSLCHTIWFKHTAHQQPTGTGWSYVKVRK